jgi:hypothetical protein
MLWLIVLFTAIGAYLADRQTAHELGPTKQELDEWMRERDEWAKQRFAEQLAAYEEYRHYRDQGQLWQVSGLPGRH